MSLSANDSNLRKSQILDDLISRSASKPGAGDMDSFFGMNQEILDSPDIKDLRVKSKILSMNTFGTGKNDYDKMRDTFFMSKRTGTLKLNKQKTSTYENTGLINLLNTQDDIFRLTDYC